MELVTDYLYKRYIPQRDPLPFPDYLDPNNKWENDFWITKEGECVHPWEMSDRHLLNTVRLIHRTKPELCLTYDKCTGDQYVLNGMNVFYVYSNKTKKNKKGQIIKNKIPQDILFYCDLWTDYRLYMLLRREIKIRGLEKEL